MRGPRARQGGRVVIRLLIILAGLFVATATVSWLADAPGTITYDWRGRSGRLTTTEGVALLAAGGVVLLVFAELVRLVWRLPRLIRERRLRARQRRGWQALSSGVVAVAAGDGRKAGRAATQALSDLPSEPLAGFLAAQAAQLRGDREAAVAHFGVLAQNPETAALGLRGLAMEAERAGDHAAALAHARTALALDATLPWAAETVFRASAAAGDIGAALARLNDNVKAKLIDKPTHRRLRAVLLTAEAMKEGDPAKARAAALEAHGLAKDFVPAALAASASVAERSRRQAVTILEETYRRSPHPDLFRAALDLEGGAADARLKRARTLAALRPEHIESALGLARAALSAREAEAAREVLVPHLDAEATQRVCILMAEIEAVAPGDEGRVRDWLARAVRARRDPQWIADGVSAARWAPMSPVTGKLDAFEWRVPPSLGEPPVPAIDLSALAPAPFAVEAEPVPAAAPAASPARAGASVPVTSGLSNAAS